MCNYLLLELIKKFRKNDYDAEIFESIYNEFKGLILLYSARLKGDDATQDLLLFLLELLHKINLNTFAEDESDGLSRYISVSLRNKYIALSKGKCRSDISNLPFEAVENFLVSVPYEYTEIDEIMNQLSEKQRLIITYKYIYNFSDCEISEILGISRQAVNRLKNRALEALKKFYFHME